MDIPEIRYARSVGDVDIAYSDFGREDGPRLVWVSGFISHLEMNWEAAPYANLIGPLSEACRVIAFDKRGTASRAGISASGAWPTAPTTSGP